VLTLTKAALHAQGPAIPIDHDHRVQPIELARAAQVLDFLPRTKHAINAQGSIPNAQCSTERQLSIEGCRLSIEH